MRLTAFGDTHIGKRRASNQDAFIADTQLGVFVVADGVGGRAKGEVASREAAEQVHNYIRQNRPDWDEHSTPNEEQQAVLRRLLESAVQSACYLVFGIAEQEPSHRGMATTLSALLIWDRIAVTAQVGDSRIYRLRSRGETQLTEDHTLVNFRVKKGLLTPEQARSAKDRNIVTRVVGQQDYVEVDTSILNLDDEERFVLCSDGLHGYLQPGNLWQLIETGPVETAPERLIEWANQCGGKDNITALVVSASFT